ncbi:MAG: GTPase [Bacteroidia bacterium]|nr:GTPase [Bacteroidia bacterium]NNF31841.1 GTPase [Flavobacteriaceae bacterium]MBT8275288.1 GTPase [Bacteroidia bacterium]NNJ83266.1 GTPase [Flavobacteriaceae bacterium]NNK53320.1 GTPase [Flavobacteriaceae bacterium]
MSLLFVYNANSGAMNAILDSMHKVLSPSTYDCKLCELTYSTFSERSAWKDFRDKSTLDMRFLHKDEFQKEYRSKWLPKYEFPVVLASAGKGLEIFISSEDFEGLDSQQALIDLIQERLSLY